MEDLKKLNVAILGKSYVISTNEGESQAVQAAKLVDSVMRNVAAKTSLKDNYKIAVLTALQLANDLQKHKNKLEAWKNKAEDLELLLN